MLILKNLWRRKTRTLLTVPGIAIGAGLALAATKVPLYGSFLLPVFTPGLFLETILITLGLGILGGIYPAWHASNLRPIEALRYE